MFGEGPFSRLEEDISCSLCLSELTDVVSTACGHTFCRGCISAYWGPLLPMDARCPECRKICSNKQLIPIYRLQSLVTKVQHPAKSKTIPGAAVQLAYLDHRGRLQLNESVVQGCFLDGEIAECPLSLICVIGEKRTGKSTLLNYILRALQRRERGQPFCLGQEDEPLTGFDWRYGDDRVTKGIWIWSRPFILERNGEKMVVYLLDTEGFLDVEGGWETFNKLSALSVLLSSYLIFNVSKGLTTAELDYLEMYLHISEVIEESFSLQHLQHLDVVVRDWRDPDQCGREAARAYLERKSKKVQRESGSEHRRVLKALRSASVSGFLLPHPGSAFLRSGRGRLEDMEEDFRDQLTTYISDLGTSLRRHQKTGLRGERLSCAHVGRALTEIAEIFRNEVYRFSPPVQIIFSIKNHKNTNVISKAFWNFLEKQVSLSSAASAFRVLGMKPSQMKSKVSEQASLLLERYHSVLVGDPAEKKHLMVRMESLLLEKQDKFCAEYSKRFTKCAVGVGCAVGGGVLAVAGGLVGAAAAGFVFAAEAVGLMGSSTMALVTGAVGGSVTLGAIGTGVGAGVGSVLGHMEEKRCERRATTKGAEEVQRLVD